MRTLQERIAQANTLLAPYAVPHEGILGREHEELPDETRFPFQRDRDRIIHTQGFRRLQGKTQVFLTGTHDHVRTRLTHTLEVAQISRDIARCLSLNEDLAESIALAHDLGHPPFGHAGEDALDRWMRGYGKHFEHNEQSHRIVTVLAEHSSRFLGLNLQKEILFSLLKHRTPHDRVRGGQSPRPLLEAQVVNLADEIAYTGHDCEDGIRAELFTAEDLPDTSLTKNALALATARGSSLRGAIIHHLVWDLITRTEEVIHSENIQSLEDVTHTAQDIVCFSDSLRGSLESVREFLWKRMYLHPEVFKISRNGQKIIDDLCDQYMHRPPRKVSAIQERTGSALEEAIKDYVCGMTDDYALRMHREEHA